MSAVGNGASVQSRPKSDLGGTLSSAVYQLVKGLLCTVVQDVYCTREQVEAAL